MTDKHNVFDPCGIRTAKDTPVERLKNWLSATDLDGPWRVPKDVAALIAAYERDQMLLSRIRFMSASSYMTGMMGKKMIGEIDAALDHPWESTDAK